MNLIDAIKSGRPFKRALPSWRSFHVVRHRGEGADREGYFWVIDDEGEGTFAVEDILADDWEILEPTVTISRTQFLQAMEDVLTVGRTKLVGFEGRNITQELARKLGLGDP